jgi:hypothetical protein
MDNGHMSGVLFFDGACGMCTRSRDLLLRLNRTGDLSTEPLQGLAAARNGPVVGLVRRGVRRRRGRQRGAVGRDRDQAAFVRLPNSGCPIPAGRRVPVGRHAPLPVPRKDSVLRITSRRLLTIREFMAAERNGVARTVRIPGKRPNAPAGRGATTSTAERARIRRNRIRRVTGKLLRFHLMNQRPLAAGPVSECSHRSKVTVSLRIWARLLTPSARRRYHR